MNIINKKIELSDGRVIEIETGKLAKQADGSAVIKMGGTMLLATVTCAKEVKEGTDFMPLQVDYKEKFYSAGRFPGGFMKREGKASDYEILIIDDGSTDGVTGELCYKLASKYKMVRTIHQDNGGYLRLEILELNTLKVSLYFLLMVMIFGAI